MQHVWSEWMPGWWQCRHCDKNLPATLLSKYEGWECLGRSNDKDRLWDELMKDYEHGGPG